MHSHVWFSGGSRAFRKRAWSAAAAFLTAIVTLSAAADDWKAGIGRSRITPEQPIWMSGYAARTRPAEGTRTDLWAKALALEDPNGRRAVLVTLDLVGIGRELSLAIRERIAGNHNLDFSQIALCASHTHTGPVVRHNLRTMYALSEEEWLGIVRYSERLSEKAVEAVEEAFVAMAPAELSWAEGFETFAVNRRNNPEKEVPRLRSEGALNGPVDYSVPVLRVGGSENELKAVVFGYACHATVLSDYQWSGDYPGFAQAAFEEKHPGATALFWAGCGADSNPLPRRTAALAESYGARLAAAAELALEGTLRAIDGGFETSYREIDLPFEELPTRDQIERDSGSENRFVAARAEALLERLENDGALAPSYSYPISVWKLGDDLKWIFLGGEVVVDYALRLKRELGPGTWVTAYANDVMAYIPSLRVWKEGGYEGGGAMVYYGLPARWAPEVEELIVEEALRQAD